MNEGTIVYEPKSPNEAVEMCRTLSDLIVGCLRYLEFATEGNNQCKDLIQHTNAFLVKLALLDLYLNPDRAVDAITGDSPQQEVNVVELDDFRSIWRHGQVKCSKCGNEQVSVWPDGPDRLQCVGCGQFEIVTPSED